MFKIILGSALAVAGVTGSTVTCKYGPDLTDTDGNTKPLWAFNGVSPVGCLVFKIQLARFLHQYPSQIPPGMAAFSTAKMNLTEALGANPAHTILAGETCPAVTGDPFFGMGCSTWKTDNTTHPKSISGKVPDSHVLPMACINNQAITDEIVANLHPAKPGQEEAWAVAMVYGAFKDFQNLWCKPMMGPVTAANPAPWFCNPFGHDFMGKSIHCCEAAATVVQHSVLTAGKDSPASNLTDNMKYCPYHTPKHDGCLEDGITPKAESLELAIAEMKKEDCKCGAHVISNTTQQYMFDIIDANGNGVIDVCDPTTTTTTTTAAEEDDSSSAYTVSGSVMLLFASLMNAF